MNVKSKIKTTLRWLLWGIGSVSAVCVGLIIADTLHTKTCSAPALEGKIIEVPGERMEVLSSGDVLSLDVVREPFSDPNYDLPAADGHIHPHQEERFEILEGRARFLIGDQDVVLTPGQIGIVPPNTLHHWMALDGKPVHVKAEFAPALDTGAWFLHFQGHIAQGDMDLLQAAVISSEYEEGAPLPVSPPPAFLKVLVKILAPVGRLLGYSAC